MKRWVWLALLVPLAAASLGCPGDGPGPGTDNQPPQQPAPGGNRGDGGGQKDPQPAPADPKPSPSSNAATRNIFVTVNWDGDRQMDVTVYIDGNRTPLVARAEGPTTAKSFPFLARVGSAVEVSATPTLAAKRSGANMVWAKTDTEQVICISDEVPSGTATCHGTVPPKK